jgi:AraC-like DNA-binding protein
MEQNTSGYINSVNINGGTPFPYLVLSVENDKSFPLNPGFRVMHWHEDLQFIYVISGRIRVKTLAEEEVLSEGEGVFINSNVVHSAERDGNCSYRSFIFPQSFVSFYPGSPAEELTKEITRNSSRMLMALRRDNGWKTDALNILLTLSGLEEKEHADIYPYEVLSLLSVLWLMILKNAENTEERETGLTAQRMRIFLHYIEEHYGEEITLEKLSQSACVSISECLRCFHSSLQTTPCRYIMDYRLSKAAELLRKTDLPITEISAMTGFNAQSYFGLCFRKKAGCTPKEFRSGLTLN